MFLRRFPLLKSLTHTLDFETTIIQLKEYDQKHSFIKHIKA